MQSVWTTLTTPKASTVMVPTGKSGGSVLYIFPGIDNFPYSDGSKTGASWMVKQVPDALAKGSAVVVARNSSTSWAEVSDEANRLFANAGYTPKDTYAMGFSGGATVVLGSALTTAGWKRVMLVDPSIPASMRSAIASGGTVPGLDSRVEMTYNDENWGGYPETKAAMVPLADAINRQGGKATKIRQLHAKFVTDGFQQMLNAPNDPSIYGVGTLSVLGSTPWWLILLPIGAAAIYAAYRYRTRE